jgi:hypothetical protein
MKFLVIGQNRDTGARMSLEFEAESKAAAERKATQQGMSVHRVQDITDGYPPQATPAKQRSGTARPRRGRLPWFLLGIALGALVWWNRAWILPHLHH